MNRKTFYDSIRNGLGPLTEANVAGFELFLTEGEKRQTELNHLAYILATVWWETGKTMQPVREAYYISPDFKKAEAWRKKNLRYYPYYGRSYPQFTWLENYKKASELMGVDFVKDPDKIMDPKYGVPLTFSGMSRGWFTGKKLDDFIDDLDESDQEDLREFSNARRIVNGTDRQVEIGKLAIIMEKGLRAAGYAKEEIAPPIEKPVAEASSEPERESFWTVFLKLLSAIFRRK